MLPIEQVNANLAKANKEFRKRDIAHRLIKISNKLDYIRPDGNRSAIILDNAVSDLDTIIEELSHA